MFADAATADVHAALGANGFVTVSGYDLGTAAAGVANSPDEYGALLAAELAGAPTANRQASAPSAPTRPRPLRVAGRSRT